jgi:hypothetical protein
MRRQIDSLLQRFRSEAGKDLGMGPSLKPIFCIWMLEGIIFDVC